MSLFVGLWSIATNYSIGATKLCNLLKMNRLHKCKYHKVNFIPKYPFQKFCLSDDECIKAFNEFVKAEKEKQRVKQWQKEKKVIKESLLTKSDCLNIAQKVFNTYIRLRDKGKNCISCKSINYTSSCGHYYSSGNHKNVTFNEDNCHAQCWYYCNSKLSGNLIEYRKGLIDRIGVERLEHLDSIAKIEKKYTIEELKEIIKKYREKIAEIKNN